MSVNDQMATSGMVDANGNQWGEGTANYVVLSDQAAMEAALADGPISVTVAAGALQRGVGMENGWVIVSAPADRGYDHEPAISAAGQFSALASLLGTSLPSGIDPTTYGYMMFTWGTVGLIDRQSLLNIGQDAAAVRCLRPSPKCRPPYPARRRVRRPARRRVRRPARRPALSRDCGRPLRMTRHIAGNTRNFAHLIFKKEKTCT